VLDGACARWIGGQSFSSVMRWRHVGTVRAVKVKATRTYVQIDASSAGAVAQIGAWSAPWNCVLITRDCGRLVFDLDRRPT